MSGADATAVRADRTPGGGLESLLTVLIPAGLAGGFAWAAAQLGLKGVVAVVGGLVFLAVLVVVRDRPTFVLFALVMSLGFLMHKSVGPLEGDIASGPPSLYVTTFDCLLLLLYGLWFLEGTLVPDLIRALRRPVVWLPIIAIGAWSLSLVGARNLNLAIAELGRAGWMFLTFVYVAARVRTRRHVWAVLAALGLLAAFEFVLILAQWKTHSVLGLDLIGTPLQLGERTLDQGDGLNRPFGTITHPVFMGAVMSTIGLVALSLGCNLRRSWVRRVSVALVPVCVVPLLISQTRAALVAFATAGGILGLVALVRGRIPAKTTVVLGAVAITTGIAFGPQLVERYRDNFGTEHFRLEVESRSELNAIAMRMIRDHAFLGVGLNNFQQAMEPYDPYGAIFAGNPVHNLYLLYWAETGAFGLAALLLVGGGLVFLALRLARSGDRLFSAVGAGVAAVYLFFAVEEVLGFSLRQDIPLALFWLLAGVSVACLRMSSDEQAAAGGGAAPALEPGLPGTEADLHRWVPDLEPVGARAAARLGPGGERGEEPVVEVWDLDALASELDALAGGDDSGRREGPDGKAQM